MNMQEAVKAVLSKYATFEGRASRSEFWWYVLALIIVAVIIKLVDGALVAPMLGFEPFDPMAGQPLSIILALVFLLPSLAVTVRRLHDIDRSGWWYFVNLVPLIGPLVLLYWEVQPGTEGTNQFGEANSR
jgi:uncharacterized membrane protein YhaH (DUF805 family)